MVKAENSVLVACVALQCVALQCVAREIFFSGAKKAEKLGFCQTGIAVLCMLRYFDDRVSHREL